MNAVALHMFALLSLGIAAGLSVASAQSVATHRGSPMDEELRIALQGEDKARIRALVDGGAAVTIVFTVDSAGPSLADTAVQYH